MNTKMRTGIMRGVMTGMRIAVATMPLLVLIPIAQPAGLVAAAGPSLGEATADWNVMVERLDEAVRNGVGQNVDFSVGDTFVIPTDLLEKMAGKNATLAMHTGNGIAFTLSGKDVRQTDLPVQMKVSFETVIPEELLAQIPSRNMVKTFGMEQKEAYPCPVNVHLGLGAEHAGRHAVLYSYDELLGGMRQEGIFRITGTGNAMFPIRRGDEYAVAVLGGCTALPGDTLSQIARRNGVSLSDLKRVNPQIKDANRIRVGEPVNIPSP